MFDLIEEVNNFYIHFYGIEELTQYGEDKFLQYSSFPLGEAYTQSHSAPLHLTDLRVTSITIMFFMNVFAIYQVHKKNV